METHIIPKERRRFLPMLERYEPVVLDSSAITAFKKCRRLFFFEYVISKKLKDEMPYLYFGGAYHKFREYLEIGWKHYIKDLGVHTLSRVALVDGFPNAYLLEAIKQARALFKKSGGDPTPGSSKWDFMTDARLIHTCTVAFAYWKAEKIAGNIEVIEVEIPINFLYANGNRKCGRMDQLIKWQGKLWVRDFKCSGKNPAWYPKQLQIKDQAYTYITGATIASGQRIEGIIYEQMYNEKDTKKDGQRGPSIHSHMIQYTPKQLANWNLEQELIHKQIDMCREMDMYPMSENDMACQWCNYNEVCQGMNENMMMSTLTNKFKTRIWDNMNPETASVHDDE